MLLAVSMAGSIDRTLQCRGGIWQYSAVECSNDRFSPWRNQWQCVHNCTILHCYSTLLSTLNCTILLFCTVKYCTVLYTENCTELHYISLHCNALYWKWCLVYIFLTKNKESLPNLTLENHSSTRIWTHHLYPLGILAIICFAASKQAAFTCHPFPIFNHFLFLDLAIEGNITKF